MSFGLPQLYNLEAKYAIRQLSMLLWLESELADKL